MRKVLSSAKYDIYCILHPSSGFNNLGLDSANRINGSAEKVPSNIRRGGKTWSQAKFSLALHQMSISKQIINTGSREEVLIVALRTGNTFFMFLRKTVFQFCSFGESMQDKEGEGSYFMQEPGQKFT